MPGPGHLFFQMNTSNISHSPGGTLQRWHDLDHFHPRYTLHKTLEVYVQHSTVFEYTLAACPSQQQQKRPADYETILLADLLM
jgi:hypothetical protein